MCSRWHLFYLVLWRLWRLHFVKGNWLQSQEESRLLTQSWLVCAASGKSYAGEGIVFPCPESLIAQERALQSTRNQRQRVWGLNKQCPDPCSSEAIGQRNPEELLQSRYLLTCWTKMESGWNNLYCMTVMGGEHTYFQNLLLLFLFWIIFISESSLLQFMFKYILAYGLKAFECVQL